MLNNTAQKQAIGGLFPSAAVFLPSIPFFKLALTFIHMKTAHSCVDRINEKVRATERTTEMSH